MMPRQEALDLTRRVLKHFENDTLDIADGVYRQPASAFVDQSRFDAEVAMLRGVPHVVGWVGEVAKPGSYTTKDVMGVPVLVARGKDGALRAFVNGCAHRGAQVATDCGTTRMFSCPYHGWTYGLDGRLTGVPAKKMFAGALDGRTLTPLPVAEQSGFIVVGLSNDVDVADHLASAAEALDQYGFASRHHVETRRFVVDANWKLTININFEGYHFPFVHGDTLDPIATNNSVIDTWGQHVRFAFPFRECEKFRTVAETEWPDDFYGTIGYGLFPSCVLVEAPGSYQMLRVYPGRRPGESVAYLTYGSPTEVETEQEREFYRMAMDATCNILLGQDVPMAESCQRGLEGGVPEVVFGANEPMLHYLAEQWQAAVSARR
jgi:phenylpropionate dioxygenase-like ring-hydroxylating dioxygenase large terminal subunit